MISLNITRKMAGARSFLPSQLFLQVVADGLAFAIRIGRQVDGIHFLGGCLQLRDELLLAFDHFVAGLETVFDIHREILLGKIFDVTERSFHHVLLAQIFVDGLRLCRRFHDYQSFCHK